MAIYHATVKSFSRSKGHSATAAAAYRAGLDLVDTGARVVHRYSQRKGVVAHFQLAPAGSPSWCSEPTVFWDANQAWESRANARVAREVETSLPSQLDGAQREALALALGQALVDRYKVAVLVAIHGPGKHSDTRNHHVHLLLSAREIGPDGFGARACAEFDARGGKGHKAICEVRAMVSNVINEHLQRAGHEVRVDHRRLTVQAEDAASRGDFIKAIELTRPPKRRVDRETFIESWKERRDLAAADQRVEQAAKEGRLLPTPASHDHTAAATERRREQTNSTVPRPRFAIPPRAVVRSSVLADRTRRLSRSAGRDAEVLNSEARVIEEWLASQLAVAQLVMASLRESPEFRSDPLMRDAMLALECHRHEDKHEAGLRCGVESLVQAMQVYGSALLKPQQDRETVQRATARVAEAEIEVAELTKSARHLRRAREDLNEARRTLMENALGRDKEVINYAHASLFGELRKFTRFFQQGASPSAPGASLDEEPNRYPAARKGGGAGHAPSAQL